MKLILIPLLFCLTAWPCADALREEGLTPEQQKELASYEVLMRSSAQRSLARQHAPGTEMSPQRIASEAQAEVLLQADLARKKAELLNPAPPAHPVMQSPGVMQATTLATTPLWLHRRVYDAAGNLTYWCRWNGDTVYYRYSPFGEVSFDLIGRFIGATADSLTTVRTWTGDAAANTAGVPPLTGARTEYLGFDPGSAKTFYLFNNFPKGAKNPSQYADRLISLIDAICSP
jgi:hypothetical protein